jgi:hypothetical protein
VAYLNGSKVLTTGSALTFDGVNLATNTGGTNATLGINSTSSSVYLQSRPDISYSRLISSVYQLDFTTVANQPISFGVNNSEAMRLTSTGLGIGTSSPTEKLTVQGNGNFRVSSGNVGIALSGSGWSYSNYFNAADNSLRWFSSTGGDRIILDSSGNLGLGVTPSAWNAYKAFQFGRQGVVFGDAGGGTSAFGSNLYWNSGWKYIVSEQASYYSQASGAHNWYTAPSGTAGNAISFTQAMTLDASGRLGIGTTSPSALLDVRGEGVFETAGAGRITLGHSGGANTLSSTTPGFSDWRQLNIAGSLITFLTGPAGANAERARIDSSGNLLVGTTSASGAERLNVTGSVHQHQRIAIRPACSIRLRR